MVTITQNFGKSVKSGGLPPLNVTVTSEFISADAAETPDDPFLESEIISVSTAGMWREYIPSAPLGSDVQFESLTPATAEYTGGRLIRVGSGGPFVARGFKGAREQVFVGNTSSTAGIFKRFNGYVSGSVADVLAQEIIVKCNPEKSADYFTNYAPGSSSGLFVKNANSWCSGVDLSGVPIQTTCKGKWSSANRGAAITRRHVMGAHHWNTSAGTKGAYVGMKYRFLDINGEVHERTVLSVVMNGMDLIVCTLDQDLPLTVKPLKVVGDWYARNRTYIPRSDGSSDLQCYNGGLFFYVNRNYQCKLVVGLSRSQYALSYSSPSIESNGVVYNYPVWKATYWGSVDTNNYHPPYFSNCQHLFQQAQSGDSGSITCALIANEPCAVSSWFFATDGPFLGEFDGEWINGVIKDADVSAGISTGTATTPGGAGTLTVTVAPNPTL